MADTRGTRPIPHFGLHLHPADVRVGDEIHTYLDGGELWLRVRKIWREGIRPSRLRYNIVAYQEPEPRVRKASKDHTTVNIRPDGIVRIWPHDGPQRPPSVPEFPTYESGSW